MPSTPLPPSANAAAAVTAATDKQTGLQYQHNFRKLSCKTAPAKQGEHSTAIIISPPHI